MGIIDDIENTHNFSLISKEKLERIIEDVAYASIDKYKWNHYGSGKVRRIDAGVKTLQFSQENINSILKNRR